MKIIKTGWFEAAHMLSGYVGMCANLHGHSYEYAIAVDSPLDTDCMVLDFNAIKTIIAQYDHALIFSSKKYRGEAEEELLEWADKWGMHIKILTEGRATAECIAAQIKREIEDTYNVRGVSVTLSETRTGTVYAD